MSAHTAAILWALTLLVLDLCLHVLNGVGRLHLQRDGLAREGLDKDLHVCARVAWGHSCGGAGGEARQHGRARHCAETRLPAWLAGVDTALPKRACQHSCLGAGRPQAAQERAWMPCEAEPRHTNGGAASACAEPKWPTRRKEPRKGQESARAASAGPRGTANPRAGPGDCHARTGTTYQET